MHVIWIHGLSRNRIVESRTVRKGPCRGTSIAVSTSGTCDKAASGNATTSNNPTTSSSSASPWAPGFTRDIRFSTRNHSAHPRSRRSRNSSKKTSVRHALRFGDGATHKPDQAYPFAFRSSSAAGSDPRSRSNSGDTRSAFHGDAPFIASKRDSIGFGRRLQFRQCRYLRSDPCNVGNTEDQLHH